MLVGNGVFFWAKESLPLARRRRQQQRRSVLGPVRKEHCVFGNFGGSLYAAFSAALPATSWQPVEASQLSRRLCEAPVCQLCAPDLLTSLNGHSVKVVTVAGGGKPGTIDRTTASADPTRESSDLYCQVREATVTRVSK